MSFLVRPLGTCLALALVTALFSACGSSTEGAAGPDGGATGGPDGGATGGPDGGATGGDAFSPPPDGNAPGDAATDAGTDAAAAVTAYACPTSAPEAAFVSEVAPPPTLAPWSRPFATVTFANCGATTWTAAAAYAPTGVKLGPSSPRDLELWTPTRIALPADVPPQHQVTVTVPVHAPPLTGTHAYAFQIVREGVAWIGDPSPTHLLDVETVPAAPVALCPGTTADPTGRVDARAALQSCLDQTPAGGTLALPPGIFRLSGVVSITKGMTLTTAGAAADPASCLSYGAPKCAVLRADDTVSPAAASTRGFVRLGALGTAVSQVTVDHVLVDGNRAARLGSAAATACANGNNGEGINVGANCASCTLTGFASARAICGSGLEWDGDGITVNNSVFWGNGDHGTQNMWSDGLTIHKSDNGKVLGSSFIDNSDVGFISGGGVNASYTNNYAAQLSQTAFAAVMLDNFNSAALGDHTGAMLTGNTVVCPAGCHFGIELGPHPWYASPNIKGGTVTGNSVHGANIEINAQGAGVAGSPTAISGNDLGPVAATAAFQCGNVSGLSPLNVSAESIVDLKGGAATGAVSVPCP
jgi:Pectate lyase superfamily protein